ncbi:MAG: rhodanese-like domain-containing protein, partial [Eubacteriaceae bacterium]
IRVDERMLTSDPDIYAIGDAVENFDFTTGQPVYSPLAGPANKQGRQVAGDICGLPFANTGTQGSAVVKLMDMTVAATGINEKTARRLGLDYGVSYTFSPSHATYYPGAEQMMIKTIYENGSGKILGAQISGLSKVDKRAQVFATAIRAGMTADDLTRIDLTYAPPYGSAKDPVNMAGYVVQNILNGLVRTIQYQDVIRLPRNGSVQLIDVRNPGEYEKGHIPDFINIPLDSIRDRMDEIDKDKPVYVTCQVGLRGYLAARILMQNGYDVWNLSGGYRIYKLMEG